MQMGSSLQRKVRQADLKMANLLVLVLVLVLMLVLMLVLVLLLMLVLMLVLVLVLPLLSPLLVLVLWCCGANFATCSHTHAFFSLACF